MPAVATEDSLITLTQPSSEAAEAFRRLRTNVQFADVDRPVRSLALVAAQSRAGKSTIAANLAVAFAQAGRQTILVDADLLHPAQHVIFGVPNDAGLATALNGEASVDTLLRATVAPDVKLLTAGPPVDSPAPLLNSSRMGGLLERLGEFAEVVILDTPALADLADSALLAAKVDGVLLVADSGQSRRGELRAARDLLNRVHAPLLGVVLNHGQEQSGLFGLLPRRA